MELSQNYSEVSWLRRRSVGDWLFALALAIGAGFALNRYGHYMDYYEHTILVLCVPAFALLGWHWRSVRWLMAGIAILALSGIGLYHHDLARADQAFLLKYFLSSQSAILWMSALFFLATTFYWGGLIARSPFGASVGSTLCWAA
ncbi:MAG: c-type cytochrome biogenesis protein CcsB, partial [Pandoraea sp.]|nr:c-type cytochrome biogenesis protein CcsB [Pandoraea sp.]